VLIAEDCRAKKKRRTRRRRKRRRRKREEQEDEEEEKWGYGKSGIMGWTTEIDSNEAREE
jgi:hypothetical protein